MRLNLLAAPCFAWSPSPAPFHCAGADKRHRSPDASAPEFCQPRRHHNKALLDSPQQRREAERRQAHHPLSAPHNQMSPSESARARKRVQRDALASRRSAAALVPATERRTSAQAALHAKERTQALPAPSFALKRSTPRAGRYAGGDDARTARERGYKPRPQEPHSLHQSAVTGDVPDVSEIAEAAISQFNPRSQIGESRQWVRPKCVESLPGEGFRCR
jgi:hypothetical protein